MFGRATGQPTRQYEPVHASRHEKMNHNSQMNTLHEMNCVSKHAKS